MRIAVSLSLTPNPLYKRENVVKDYLREKLEVEYTKAVKQGFGRIIYGFYISAAKAIESGKKNLALKILDAMQRGADEFERAQFDFGGKFECNNCALVSVAEDMEILLRLEIFYRKNGIKKLYFNYDRSGRFVPKGAILDIDTIRKIYEMRFVAVA